MNSEFDVTFNTAINPFKMAFLAGFGFEAGKLVCKVAGNIIVKILESKLSKEA